MTRTYAAKRLLEHGPLTFANFWAITGWQKEEAKEALDTLVKEKKVKVTFDNYHFNPMFGLTGDLDA
jgi:hypothetical protein